MDLVVRHLVGAGLAILVTPMATAQVDLPGPQDGVVLSWPSLPGPVIVDTSDPAVPGAQEVIEDTPNVFVWSRFQTGTVADWSYRMFPDGSAIVLPDTDQSEADFIVTCTLAVSCEISGSDGSREVVPAIGAERPSPPVSPDGPALARHVAEWILAGTGTPPPPPPAPPVVEAAVIAPEVTIEVAEPPDEPEIVAPETPAISEDCSAPDPFFPDVCDVSSGPTPLSTISRGPSGRNAAEAPRDVPQVTPSLAERFRLSCSVSTGLGLRYFDLAELDDRYGKLRVSLGCSARLTEKLSARISLVGYPVADQQQPWDPDFTYAFNYKATERVTIGYSSYTARFGGPGKTFSESLADGSLRASIRLPELPLPFDKKAACTLGVGLPDPFDTSATLSCGFSLTENLRLSGTAYVYAPGKQESFSPDYSYTASYKISDWLQFTYSNYGNNRWPWNPADSDPPGLLGGSLSLSYKLEL
ncbi:hypothetical protein [Palleronia sp. LCG004]|uniref:hypothetical protein n=1 Tax=Palleronia sp. LCG004 TaxID=3079304 RepID=UPI002943E6F0|nr:hypothetical protein [Palleronia sp. LCG004]WOI57431.1 hypothetical protein RVY76_06510 [Palleronia sp. LCG004]